MQQTYLSPHLQETLILYYTRSRVEFTDINAKNIIPQYIINCDTNLNTVGNVNHSTEGDTPSSLAYCVPPYFGLAYWVPTLFGLAYSVPFNKKATIFGVSIYMNKIKMSVCCKHIFNHS